MSHMHFIGCIVYFTVIRYHVRNFSIHPVANTMWRYFRACLSNLPAHPLEWKPSRMLTTTLLPYMCRLSHLYTFMRPMRNISIGQHLSKNAALVGKWSNHEKQLFSKHLPPVTLVSYSGKHHLSKPQTYQVTCTRIGRFPYTAISAEEAQCNRPVVVLIGWLNAKEKHLRKYQEIYWQRGFDVLMMPVSALHIVRPRHGIRYTKELLSVLQVCNTSLFLVYSYIRDATTSRP